MGPPSMSISVASPQGNLGENSGIPSDFILRPRHAKRWVTNSKLRNRWPLDNKCELIQVAICDSQCGFRNPLGAPIHATLRISLRRPGPLLLPAAVLLIIVCAGFCAACGGTGRAESTGSPERSQTFSFFRIVDAIGHPLTVQYAYAPAIILKDNVYHVFFCSGGDIFPAWDYIRYVNSTDGGKSWSSPVDMLRATAFDGNDLSACDPSVVYFQGFYYMFYGSAVTTGPQVFQTVVQVARAAAITGPYLTYTQRRTWEDTPTDPQVIIRPMMTRTQQPSGYGSGQPSVVVLNNKLLMWYTDDSLQAGPPGDFGAFRLYMLESSDPVTWATDASRQTNISGQDSPDVKYDASANRFVATWVLNMFSTQTSLVRAFSSDGITWSKAEAVIPASKFLPYTNNAGAAGDETGHLLPAQNLVGFGRPYSQDDIDHGRFDLFGVLVDTP